MASSLGRVIRVPNSKYVRSGLRSYVGLMMKYGFAPTKDGPYQMQSRVKQQGKFGAASVGGKARVSQVLMKTDATTGQVGDVPATDIQNDTEYLCEVTIGTPGQTFMLDFDSGSADLWLFSTALPANEQGTGHTLYNSADSSTFQATSGASWNISYGDGSSASGTVGTDVVNLGGLAIQNQTIELANNLSSEFISDQGDGLLGLAFDSINTVTPGPAQTPVDNLISQGLISDGLFTANLGSWRDTNDADKGVSFYTFGYIDQDVLTASGATAPSYTPVDNSQGFWMFDSASASVNGSTITRTGNTAIADTGTTLMLVDDSFVEQIYAAIPGATYNSAQQGYVFPSTVTPAQLPEVSVAVGGQLFTLHKEALAFASAGSGLIYGGVQSRGSMTFDIYGDVFLKSIYAVFDVSNTQFGAVQRPDETGDTLAPPTGASTS